jgi:ParB family chromosome partitioning protein
MVRQDVNDRKAREIQLVENYQHEDVPSLEQARSFKDYLDRYGVSQSELSRRTGIPQRTIPHRLALLKLPASVHARIEAGEIGPY